MKQVCLFASLVYLAASTAPARVHQPPPITSSSNKHAPIAVPLQLVDIGINDAGYLLNISVGNPAQQFGLTLDNEFDALHVLSVLMREPTVTSCSADISRKRFNKTASQTYVDWSPWGEDVTYAIRPYQSYCTEADVGTVGGWWAEGFSDTVKIGSAKQPSIPCRLIAEVDAPLNPKWKADGIFGISPERGFAGTTARNTLTMFLKDFERPQVTIYYARSDVCNAKDGGRMTLGGADSENCDRNWIGNYTTDFERNLCGFCLELKSASIGGRSLRIGDYNNVVTKSSFIIAPQSAIDVILKVTGAEYDFKSDTYQVDCDKRGSVPDMVFQLPDMEYRLPAMDYARRLSATDKRCTLLLKPSSQVSDYWKLGTAFFRPYCTLVDYSAQSFSLAKARH